MPVLFLNTVGRKTGQPRTNGLFYIQDGENFVVVASHLGEPRHPAWYFNLMAKPTTTIQIGKIEMKVSAREATGEERDRLWAQAVEAYSDYAVYQSRTDRLFPVVILEPVS